MSKRCRGYRCPPKDRTIATSPLAGQLRLDTHGNRQTVTNHNAIRFRVAAWKAGSSVGEFEVSQFSQILQIQPAAIAGAGVRIDRRGFHISMSDRLRHQRNRRAVVERMTDMSMSKPVPFRTAMRSLGPLRPVRQPQAFFAVWYVWSV
jgi:hypothetical protein